MKTRHGRSHAFGTQKCDIWVLAETRSLQRLMVACRSLWGFFLGRHTRVSASVSRWPSARVSSSSSLMGALVLGVEAPQIIPGDAISTFLTASAKTLFPQPHSGSGEHVFGGATILLTRCLFAVGNVPGGPAFVQRTDSAHLGLTQPWCLVLGVSSSLVLRSPIQFCKHWKIQM